MFGNKIQFPTPEGYSVLIPRVDFRPENNSSDDLFAKQQRWLNHDLAKKRGISPERMQAIIDSAVTQYFLETATEFADNDTGDHLGESRDLERHDLGLRKPLHLLLGEEFKSMGKPVILEGEAYDFVRQRLIEFEVNGKVSGNAPEIVSRHVMFMRGDDLENVE